MGRTILRTANTSDVNDISESFANFATFNGINDSNNFVSVDQNSFEDANNVYVDNHDELSTRPPMLEGITNLVSVKYVGNTIVYKTYYNEIYQYQLYYNNTWYYFDAVKNDTFYYIDGYYVIVSKDGITIYKWNNDDEAFEQITVNPLYAPTVTVITGGATESTGQYNLINSSYIVRYVMNYLISTDTTAIVDKTVVITINDTKYELTWDSNYTTTALELISTFANLTWSKHDRFMVSNIGNMTFFNYNTCTFYYSINGKSFNSIKAPLSTGNDKLGMCMSDDGTMLYCTYSYDVNVTYDADTYSYLSIMYYINLSLSSNNLPVDWSRYKYTFYSTECTMYPQYGKPNNYSRTNQNDVEYYLITYADLCVPKVIERSSNSSLNYTYQWIVDNYEYLETYVKALCGKPVMHSPNAGTVALLARCPFAYYNYSYGTKWSNTFDFDKGLGPGYIQVICHVNNSGYRETYNAVSHVISDAHSNFYDATGTNANIAYTTESANYSLLGYNSSTGYFYYQLLYTMYSYASISSLSNIMQNFFISRIDRHSIDDLSKIRLCVNDTYFTLILYQYGARHATTINDNTNTYRLDVSYSVTLRNTETLSADTYIGYRTYCYSLIVYNSGNYTTYTNCRTVNNCFNTIYSNTNYCNNSGSWSDTYGFNVLDEFATVQDDTLYVKIGVLSGSTMYSLSPHIINLTLTNFFDERYTNAINITGAKWSMMSDSVYWISSDGNFTSTAFTVDVNLDSDSYSFRYPLSNVREYLTTSVIDLPDDTSDLISNIRIAKDITSTICATNNYLYDYSDNDNPTTVLIWQHTTYEASSDTYYPSTYVASVDTNGNLFYLMADTFFGSNQIGFRIYTSNWETDWYIDITYNDYDAYNAYLQISQCVNLNISGATSTIVVGNTLYQTQFVNDSLYIDVTTAVTINDTITALVIFNQTTIGVFTANTAYEYTYDTDNAAWYLYPTKLQLGIDIGYNIIIGYDASTLYTCNQLGLCALTYENFVQSDEHIYTKLSDNIYSKYYRDYNANPIKVEKYLHWIILYNGTNVVWLYDIDAKAWWKWTLPFTVDLIWTWQQVLYFATYDSDTSLYTAYVVDFDSDDFYDYGTEVIDWNFKSQKLHFGYPNNYKHIRRISIVTTQNTEKIRYKLKFTNYKSWEQIQDKYVVEYDIDEVNTLIQKVNFMKCNAFQFEISNDTTWKYPRKFVVSNIAIKYRVTEDIR